MKINEILIENHQIDEGPLGSAAGALARGAGKAIGGVAKGVGALAGIPGGIKKAFQKGKQASTDVIGGTDQKSAPAAAPQDDAADAVQQFKAGFKGQQPQAAAEPADEPAPATAKGGGAAQQPAAAAVNKAGPQGTAPAQNLSGAAKAAADKTAAATKGQDAAQAGQTMYAQVKANIDKLDKKGKQRILQLLQKSLSAAPAKSAAAPAAAAQPAAPATGPGSKTVPATPGAAPRTEPNLNAPAAGEQPAAAAGKKKPTPKKKVAPSQAEIDADRARIMGPTSDSIIRTGNVVAEGIQIFRKK